MFFNVPTEFSVFLGERARSMNLFRFTAQCALRGNHLLFSCFLHDLAANRQTCCQGSFNTFPSCTLALNNVPFNY